MRKQGYAIILTMAMVLALGMPIMKGEAANVPVTEEEQIVEIIC